MAGLRRPSVRRLAVVLLLGLVTHACSGAELGEIDVATTPAGRDSTPTSTATSPPDPQPDPVDSPVPARPGRLDNGVVVADDQEPITLNPFARGGDRYIVSILGQTYLTGVYKIDGDTLEMIPEVVTELPTVENGGVTINTDGTMTVRYRVRSEARWSDGVPISGDDFQFTLDRVLDPRVSVDKAGYLDVIDSEVGPKSFSYTLGEPSMRFETMFGTLIPKHAVEGSDFLADWNETMWPSGGPFLVESWEKGEALNLVRNPNYWKRDRSGRRLPYLDWVQFRFIPQTEDIVEAFRAREVQVVQPPPNPHVIEALYGLEPEGATVEVVSGPVWEHIGFSFDESRRARNSGSLNGNLNFRRAVAHAIDRDRLVEEVLGGLVEPMDSFVEAYTPSLSSQAWAQYDHDVGTARDYLEAAKEEAGVDSVSVVFTTTSNNAMRVRLARVLDDMLSEIGIEYTNDLEDSELFYGESLPTGRFDLGEWAWVGSPGLGGLVEAVDLFNGDLAPPEGANYYHWGVPGSVSSEQSSQRFTQIRGEMSSAFDEESLVPLLQEAEHLLADEVVIIPLYARPSVAAVWTDTVEGFKHNPSPSTHTWNIEQWRTVED